MEQEQGLSVVDVLFEFKESRRQLTAAPSDVCEIICGELASLGKEDSIVELSRGQKQQVLPESPRLYFAAVVNKVS